jgi:tRNA1(Val) A37 N6-methylase TrmN6
VIKNTSDISKNNILDGNVTLYQPKVGFRIGMDSILLASSVYKYSKCIEFGAGSGIILVYLSKKFPNSKIIGIEKSRELVELAKINLEENKIINSSAEVIQKNLYDSSFLKNNNNEFDRVIMNPPYFSPNKVLQSKNISKASARYEHDINKWFKAAYKKLKHRGFLNFVYRTENLDSVLSNLYPMWGDIKIYPLWPKKNVKSKLMIIQARKNIKSGVQILPGLILHNNDGSYTKTCNSILNYESSIELN